MKQCWSGSELAQFWSLGGDERQLSDQRTQQGRLGLVVLLKFFQLEGRFPHYHKEVPLPVVPDSAHFIPTCCAIRAGFILLTRATT